MQDFTVIFHTLRPDGDKLLPIEVGVEFNVTENLHQIYSRIKRKMKIVYPGDWIEVRFNYIDDPKQHEANQRRMG